MVDFIEALQKLIPKEMHILERRFQVLRGIQLFAPIGRRSLSEKLSISEKIVRNEVEFLTHEALISKSAMGVVLTGNGRQLIVALEDFMKQIEGLETMERRIMEIIGCKEAIIVSGDSDHNEDTKAKIGKSASDVLMRHIEKNHVIALTGGSTIYHVVNELKPTDLSELSIRIVPARGSLGHNIIHHANSLVARMGELLKVPYTLLNIPDNLSEQALSSVRREPEIHDAIELLTDANILVFGIGNCDTMSQRRNLQGEVKALLEEKQAVAEVLGNYFNLEGDVVYKSRSIGISFDKMHHLNCPIAVVGGASKGNAIYAVRNFLKKAIVVMDEGAAKQIIKVHCELNDISTERIQ